jgi:hypothetical protein
MCARFIMINSFGLSELNEFSDRLGQLASQCGNEVKWIEAVLA